MQRVGVGTCAGDPSVVGYAAAIGERVINSNTGLLYVKTGLADTAWSLGTAAFGGAGTPGANGAPGLQGLDGADGEDSVMPGPQGPPGTGSAGATGATGAQGPTGPPGVDGEPGEDSTTAGPVGPAGPVGARGADGADGADGEDSTVPGPMGGVGATGATGAAGLNGDDGEESTIPGPPGQTGATGATGATGPASGTVVIGGGLVSGRVFCVDVCATPKRCGTFTFDLPVSVGQSRVGKPVIIQQGPGRDEADPILLMTGSVVSPTKVKVIWQSLAPFRGRISPVYLIGA